MQYIISMAVVGWIVAGYYGYQTYKTRKAVSKLIRDTLKTMKRVEAEDNARYEDFIRGFDRKLN